MCAARRAGRYPAIAATNTSVIICRVAGRLCTAAGFRLHLQMKLDFIFEIAIKPLAPDDE
jgi:hypothetical protein